MHHPVFSRVLLLVALIPCVLTTPVLNAMKRLVPQDYSTVQEAIDDSAVDDTVAIAPGIYFEHCYVTNQIHLLGLGDSPAETVLDATGWPNVLDYTPVPLIPWEYPPTRVENLTLRGSGNSAIQCGQGQNIFVSRCLITGNEGMAISCPGFPFFGNRLHMNETTIAANGPTSTIIWMGSNSHVAIERTIIAGNLGEAACRYDRDTPIGYMVQCVNHHERDWNSWTGFLQSYQDEISNISMDPLFIDPVSDFRLAAGSPCLPDNIQCSPQIGALGEGPGLPGFSARFWMDDHTDRLPADVQFHALDYDQPLEYRWDTDGDGVYDAGGKDPLVRYDQAGIYSVTLTVSDTLEREETYTLADCIQLSGRRLLVPEDYASIADAMAVSIPGDSVIVDCGIYTVNDLVVGQGVYLGSSDNNPDCVVLDGGLQGRILDAQATDSITVRGITFRNGLASGNGGAILGGRRITAFDCRFISNSAVNGGAIHPFPNTSRENVIRNCVFENNVALENGGALSNVEGEVRDCRFVDNDALSRGGAIHTESMEFLQCSLEDNRSGEGGAVFTTDGEFTGCRFVGNSASLTGGAVFVTDGVFTDCRFEGNTAGQTGGAVTGGAVEMLGCGVFGNSCQGSGGAISATYNWTGILLRYSVIQGNSAEVSGGAINSLDARVEIFDCTITGNNAPSGSVIHGVRCECRWYPGLNVQGSIVSHNGVTRPFDVTYFQASVHPPIIEASDLWSEGGFDWTDIEEFENQNCNLEQDPRFCDLENGDLHVNETSPCRSANNTCGVSMGYSTALCNAVGLPDPVLPYSLALHTAPNPFNNRTVLRIRSSQSEMVLVELYDLLGRRVLLLHDEMLAAGEHTLPIEGNGLASGVYFVQARTRQGNTAIHKILLVK